MFYFWAVGRRNQCPWLRLAGPEEAVGRGTHQAREDGWLQRLKLTVCANSSSGEPHVPSISLLTRRCKKPHNSFVIYNLFIHRHTRAHTHACKHSLRAQTGTQTHYQTISKQPALSFDLFWNVICRLFKRRAQFSFKCAEKDHRTTTSAGK